MPTKIRQFTALQWLVILIIIAWEFWGVINIVNFVLTDKVLWRLSHNPIDVQYVTGNFPTQFSRAIAPLINKSSPICFANIKNDYNSDFIFFSLTYWDFPATVFQKPSLNQCLEFGAANIILGGTKLTNIPTGYSLEKESNEGDYYLSLIGKIQ